MQDNNVKTVKVTLNQAHTHAGVDYLPGAQLDVPEHDAKWLAENGVIEVPTSTTKRGTSAEEK